MRRLLSRLGFRFRHHRKDLQRRPDIVLPKWRTVIFVKGCYWHSHENCHLFRPPKTRTEFWTNKIENNQTRNRRNHVALQDAGWKVVVIWECVISKQVSLSAGQLEDAISAVLASSETLIDITG